MKSTGKLSHVKKTGSRNAAGVLAGLSVTKALSYVTKKGNVTLIRRFMEPLYLTRSLFRAKPVRAVINTLLLALSLLLLAGTLAGRISEARTGEPASLLGLKPVVVMSGSMEPALRTHALAIVQKTADVRRGDILLFQGGGNWVLHRYHDTASDGRIVTKGDSNAEADYRRLPREAVYGKVLLPLNFTAPLVELAGDLSSKLRAAVQKAGSAAFSASSAFFSNKCIQGCQTQNASHNKIPGPSGSGISSVSKDGSMSVLGAERTEDGPGEGLADGADDSKEAAAIFLMNERRQAAGLKCLTLLPGLSEAAVVRAREASVCWSHTRPDGSAWYTAGRGTAYGENLAKGYRSASSVCDAWMASPSHAANILSPYFSFVCVATYMDERGCLYWSVEFA